MLEAEQIKEIITTLDEAQEILIAYDKEANKEAREDMDVSEWNHTPIGRAVGGIQHAIDMLWD